MRLAPLQVLADSEIQQIHHASLEILSSCGVKILQPELLDTLKSLGLPVDDAARTVRFPKNSVEHALALIPPHFEVFDREGAPAFVLGDGSPKIAAGHNAVFWLDSDTGQTRPSRTADVDRFARLCEALHGIHMIGIPVMPQDVPDPEASLLYGVRACAANSRKPLFFSTDNPRINRAIIDMLQAIFPGNLAAQPYGIAQLSPTSPLFWESTVADAFMETVRRGIPLAVLPEPNAGISAPYTLAGLLTVNNVECLSGLVMAQLLCPGANVLYANSWTATDMRNGYALVGSAETSICRIAGAQLARFYHVPCHTTAPNSDNHAHDEQNAWEKTLSVFCAVGAANDLIVNCGMFATGMTCSHEQLLMDEEISNLSRRIAGGLDVTPETVAKDLIMSLGPGRAEYMTSEHTMAWLRSDEYYISPLAVRGPRAVWEAAGSKDICQCARERADELLRKPAAPLDAARHEAISEILSSFTVSESPHCDKDLHK